MWKKLLSCLILERVWLYRYYIIHSNLISWIRISLVSLTQYEFGVSKVWKLRKYTILLQYLLMVQHGVDIPFF